ncbi:hypothetical protein HMPREF1517_2043 [Streptococcus sp. ACS2]|nr:hypothetical protein HMPREF1517_2043 [Streptococcus sp. ACS2]
MTMILQAKITMIFLLYCFFNLIPNKLFLLEYLKNARVHQVKLSYQNFYD